MPFIESNNDSDKLKIYYELYGKDKLDTVVLIHPIGGNIEIWREEISLISKKNLRILAYDLRGHGKSNMGIKNHFTISDLVQDLESKLSKVFPDKSSLSRFPLSLKCAILICVTICNSHLFYAQ